MLRDILRGDDHQINAVINTLVSAQADVVVLQNIDFYLENSALNALADAVLERGLSYPNRFALRPNTGIQTGLDLDGNRKLGEARDAQGYGEFFGQGGMAILSRWPTPLLEVTDFSSLLWRDLPGALLPQHTDGSPFPNSQAQDIQRLSTTGHWVVPIDNPGTSRIWLLVFHATPPVFDGPEDRNGKRNHDETVLWTSYMDGAFGAPVSARFVIVGGANADPVKGDGRKNAIQGLISDRRLQDPLRGAPTVLWPAPGPGAMRVDYLLPSKDLKVIDKGSINAPEASRHDLIWLQLE